MSGKICPEVYDAISAKLASIPEPHVFLKKKLIVAENSLAYLQGSQIVMKERRLNWLNGCSGAQLKNFFAGRRNFLTDDTSHRRSTLYPETVASNLKPCPHYKNRPGFIPA